MSAGNPNQIVYVYAIFSSLNVRGKVWLSSWGLLSCGEDFFCDFLCFFGFCSVTRRPT